MIDHALGFLEATANAYLSAGLGDDIIKLEQPKRSEGGAASGRLLMCLINVEEELVFKAQTRTERDEDGRVVYLKEPDLRLNLHLLVAADYQEHPEALKALSSVATFFQSRRRFTPARDPGLDPRIETLTLELENIDYEKQNNIWGALGTSYLPSVVYRVRLLALQAGEREADGAPVTAVDVQGH